jgi:hypothetical protein
VTTPIAVPPPYWAVLNLRCPNGHAHGRLIRTTGDDTIHYESAPGQPLVPWTSHTDYGYFNVACVRAAAIERWLNRRICCDQGWMSLLTSTLTRSASWGRSADGRRADRPDISIPTTPPRL